MVSVNLMNCMRWIIRNTVVSRDHLVPSIPLRLLTPECPMYMSQPDKCPFPDPYWAFFWPGGQAVSRFLLDNPEVVRGRVVLDLGCGCGAGTVSAAMGKPKTIMANDIDPVALLATKLNCRLNQVNQEIVTYLSQNLLKVSSSDNGLGILPDVILLGDMFYDDEFAKSMFYFLKQLSNNRKNAHFEPPWILVGDPGRHGLSLNHGGILTTLASFPLPPEVTAMHYGFTTTKVHRLCF